MFGFKIGNTNPYQLHSDCRQKNKIASLPLCPPEIAYLDYETAIYDLCKEELVSVVSVVKLGE
jgi:hypothetical protein